jgi:hypothetical protein
MFITPEYIEQNRQLHQTRDDFGRSGRHYIGMVGEMIRENRFRSVLDFGCGKATLHDGISLPNLSWQDYDPSIAEYSDPPRPADLVVCTDVMEHIEPDCLEAVLDQLHGLVQKMLLVTISTVPALKSLPDGRNAHLIVQPYEWWLPKFWERWKVIHMQNEQRAVLLICIPKNMIKT